MHNTLTTVSLVLLALLSLAASVVAVRRLREPQRGAKGQHLLAWFVTLGSAAVFAHQAFVVNRSWRPLTAHVDGLVLIAALLGATILFLHRRPRLEGLGAFALPLLTLILAWAVCASAWTYNPFRVDSFHPIWKAVHLACVYLGTLLAAVAAMAGGMFLYVERLLREKRDLKALGRMASLETLETLIIRTASVGFALLTLGLVTGLVIVTSEATKLGPGWWHSPKVVLATLAWGSYAVVMNVRHATAFRGSRAAWLSIAGLALLLATFGVVTALPNAPDQPSPKAQAFNERPVAGGVR